MLPIIAAVVALFAVCTSAPAQDYPARSVKILIPLAAGGGGDVFTRALADELQKAWGQPVLVENRPGGAQNVGARACAEAPADGYTICVLSTEAMIYNQFSFKHLGYDPEKDFVPIINLFFNTLAFVVNASLKVTTIQEVAALAKAKPGTLSYGTFAFPAAQFMEKLKKDTGADIVRVPFRGGAEIVTALLSGTTPVAVLALSNMIPQLQSGPHQGTGDRQQGTLAAVPRCPDVRAGRRWRRLSADVVWPVRARWHAASGDRENRYQCHPHHRGARLSPARVYRPRH